MKFGVRVLRRAQRDLVEISDYLRQDAPRSAEAIVDGLLAAMARLEDFPRRGARPRDQRLRLLRFRFLVVGKHVIFYKVVGRQVRVYRVLHGQRAYESLL